MINRRVVSAVLGVIVGLAVGTPSAHAQALIGLDDYQWFERELTSVEHRQAVTNAFFRAQGVQAMPYTVATGTAQNHYPERVGDLIWRTEQEIQQKTPATKAFHTEMYRTRTRVNVLPALRILRQAAGRIFSKAIPGVGQFMMGWEIGTGINKLFFETDLDPGSPARLGTVTEVELRPTEDGQGCYMWWTTCSAAWWEVYPEAPVIPADTLWATFRGPGNFRSNLNPQEQCRDMAEPSGFLAAAGYAYNRCLPRLRAYGYYLHPEALPVVSAPTAVMPPHWSEYGTVDANSGCCVPYKASVGLATPVSPAAADPAIEAAIEPGTGFWPRFVIDGIVESVPDPADALWDDASAPALEPDPAWGDPDGPLSGKMPDCVGVAVDTCIERLRRAGLGGEIAVRDAVPSQWTHEYGPSAVLESDPPADTLVLRTDHITVTRNADEEELGPVPPRNEPDTTEHACTVGDGGAGPDSAWGPVGNAYDPMFYVDAPVTMFSVRAPLDAVTDLARNATTVKMLMGWVDLTSLKGFGYQHIRAKHGWSQAHWSLTQAALNQPPQRWGSADRDYYKYMVQFPDPRTGAPCYWKVFVDWTKTAKEEPRDVGPRLIITAHPDPDPN